MGRHDTDGSNSRRRQNTDQAQTIIMAPRALNNHAPSGGGNHAPSGGGDGATNDDGANRGDGRSHNKPDTPRIRSRNMAPHSNTDDSRRRSRERQSRRRQERLRPILRAIRPDPRAPNRHAIRRIGLAMCWRFRSQTSQPASLALAERIDRVARTPATRCQRPKVLLQS
jgi:hypothetical protein